MRRSLASLTLMLLLCPWQAQGQEKKAEDLETVVRKLEKDIAAVRGLAFKKPVVAKIIPRPKEAGPGIQGYYSLKDKALFVYDDIKGSYERGVLIHEMVHALQDQHFSLAQLHQSSFGSEAELAMAALIEGDATWTMIELLQKDQPRVAMMLQSPLEKSRNLRNAFLYAQGARYVKALKEKGGWAAVNSAYRFPPRTTAAILFPDDPRGTVTLGPGATRGALKIVETLAAHQATASLAVQAARGWKGDRFFHEGGSWAWTVAYRTPEDARRFFDAMSKLRKAQHGEPADASATAPLWKDEKGTLHALLLREDRVHILDAADQAVLKSLRDRLESPALSVWSSKEKQFLTFGQLIDRLSEADVVCVGESHDDEMHHLAQLRIIKGLFAQDERLGVGMEMFQKPFQAALDRHIRGEIDEAAFLKESEYQQRWGFDWGLYRPIVSFCRKNGIPLAALNTPRELTRRISQVGQEKLTEEEKKQLGPIDFQLKEHRDHWLERLPKLHGHGTLSPEQKERSYQVMAAWDGYMAASAASFQKERQLRRMVILAGTGHIDRGFGIPGRVARLSGGKVLTVRVETTRPADMNSVEAVTDFIVYVEAKPQKVEPRKDNSKN